MFWFNNLDFEFTSKPQDQAKEHKKAWISLNVFKQVGRETKTELASGHLGNGGLKLI